MIIDTTELERRIGRRVDEALEAVLRALDAPETNGQAPRRWLPLRTVESRVGRSRRTIEDMVKKGQFPRWAVVFRGQRMWRESDVESWMREREEEGLVASITPEE